MSILAWGGVALLGIVIALSLYLRMGQHLFRSRTEQLVADMRSLQLSTASAREGRNVAEKWSFRQDSPDEKCTHQSCDYSLRTDNLSSRLLARFSNRFQEHQQLTFSRILTWLGARPAAGMAVVRIRREMVEVSDFSLWISTPNRGDFAFLVGSIGKGRSRYSSSNWDRPADVLERRLRHPGYLVGRHEAHVNADTFGQFRATIIWAETWPDAKENENEQLAQLDLSCLTRFTSCRESDLMPTAWTKLVADEGADHALPTCTKDVVKQVASLADLIAVVEVQSTVRELTPVGWPPRLSGIRLVKMLRGSNYARMGFLRGVEVDRAELMKIVDSGAPIRAGEQYISLLQIHSYGGSDAAALYPCGILSFNADNMAMVNSVSESPEK